MMDIVTSWERNSISDAEECAANEGSEAIHRQNETKVFSMRRTGLYLVHKHFGCELSFEKSERRERERERRVFI